MEGIRKAGVFVDARKELNLIEGTNMTITVTAATAVNDNMVDIQFDATGGSGGHTIQDDNSNMAARTNLSFQDGFVLTDDAIGDQTEVDVSYEATPSTQAFGDAAAAGTALTFTRGDHKHAMMANPITAHEAASDPHTGYILESLADAQGDLLLASADNTWARLAIGVTNGHVLTTNGTTASWQPVGAASHPAYATHAKFGVD